MDQQASVAPPQHLPGDLPVAGVATDVPGSTPSFPTTETGELVVEMRGVSKHFGDFAAIKDINLTVARGGLIALIGPSGCGKTTTVRLLLGVYAPSEGDCLVFGHSSHHISRPVRERIGYLPQQFVLYPTLTVAENINFAAATYGLGPFRRKRQREAVLELVGLTTHQKKLAGDISGGMQRRLMLAATLIHQPELVFLDEPTAGIDPILREQLWAEFRNLQAGGCTQVVTTQYVAEAEYCDTVILMDRGEIVATGPPENLRQQAAGGDLIDATIPDIDRPLLRRLGGLIGVRSARYTGDDTVRLTVDDAGGLIPQVIATVQETGGAVTKIEERRLSFNEVFVTLLERAGRDVSGVRGDVE